MRLKHNIRILFAFIMIVTMGSCKPKVGGAASPTAAGQGQTALPSLNSGKDPKSTETQEAMTAAQAFERERAEIHAQEQADLKKMTVQVAGANIDNLKGMLFEKNAILKKMAKDILAALDRYEDGWQTCLKEDPHAKRLLSKEGVDFLRQMGIDGITQALQELEDADAETRRSSSGGSKGDGGTTAWYSDQTTWGAINILVGVSMVGAALFVDGPRASFQDADLTKRYNEFLVDKKFAGPRNMDGFEKYLAQGTDVQKIKALQQAFSEERAARELYEMDVKKSKVGKGVGIGAGAGIIVGGVLMTMAGQGVFALAGGSF